jgi:hypothetical protein
MAASVVASKARRTNGKRSAVPRLIDCDVHHNTGGVEELKPFLPRHYAEYVDDFG